MKIKIKVIVYNILRAMDAEMRKCHYIDDVCETITNYVYKIEDKIYTETCICFILYIHKLCKNYNIYIPVLYNKAIKNVYIFKFVFYWENKLIDCTCL